MDLFLGLKPGAGRSHGNLFYEAWLNYKIERVVEVPEGYLVIVKNVMPDGDILISPFICRVNGREVSFVKGFGDMEEGKTTSIDLEIQRVHQQQKASSQITPGMKLFESNPKYSNLSYEYPAHLSSEYPARLDPQIEWQSPQDGIFPQFIDEVILHSPHPTSDPLPEHTTR